MTRLFIALCLKLLVISLFLTSCSKETPLEPSPTQEIVYVDNSNATGIEDGTHEHPYSTIQKAIENAKAEHNIVYIRMGNKPYQMDDGFLIDLISVKNFTIWGSGYNEGFPGKPSSGYPILQSSPLRQRPVYLKNVENVTLIGLDLRGGEQNVVYASEAKKLTIKHCKISGAMPAAVWTKTSGILIYSFGDGAVSSDITITDNIIFNNYTCGINLSNFGDTTKGLTSFEAKIENVLIARNKLYQTLDSDYPMNLPIVCESWCGLVQNITIENNEIYEFGEQSPYTPAGIFFLQRLTPHPISKNITISNNKISKSANDAQAISFHTHSGKVINLNISGNEISEVGSGIVLLTPGAGKGEIFGAGEINEAVISGNTIINSLHPNLGGMLFVSLNDGILSAKVYRNSITNSLGYGIWLDGESTAKLTADLGGGTLQSEGYNSIFNNTKGGIGVKNANVGKQFAKYNWWGSSDDPAVLIEGDIEYIPWLTTKP